jgi:hypothetical protein
MGVASAGRVGPAAIGAAGASAADDVEGDVLPAGSPPPGPDGLPASAGVVVVVVPSPELFRENNPIAQHPLTN